jgi:hypothetical protein
MAETASKYDIFVSYRKADRELVASVVRRLETRGVAVWYDAQIEGGADWRETIVEALAQSDMLAIFFSEECNSSRQLKKELAVADSLAKPVIPILIENTQPRGAYLYELADRNWIQIFPDPMAHMDELVEHLASLAGKSSGGLAGARPAETLKSQSPPAQSPPASFSSAPSPSSPSPGRAPEREETLAEREQRLDAAIGELITDAVDPGRAAPKKIEDYVGRAGSGGRPVKKLPDIPPFKWVDFAVLIPAWIAIAAWRLIASAGQYTPQTSDRGVAIIAIYCLAFAGLYGAVVFPVRYYLRRRTVLEALLKYLATSVMFFLAGAGVMLSGMDRGYLGSEDFVTFARGFAIAWLGLSVVAFGIYGALAGQRAIRSFRSNIKKL